MINIGRVLLFNLFMVCIWLSLCGAGMHDTYMASDDGKDFYFSFDSKMVFVKGGWFEMGCGNWAEECDDNEKPLHWVYVDDFYISKYEITVAQFRRFINDTGYKTESEKSGGLYMYEREKLKCERKKGTCWKFPGFSQNENHPVVGVSWNDAKEFCKWLSIKTGKNYRLPTEAEWEYAARCCGEKIKYPWGNNDPSGNECNFADRNTDFFWSDKRIDDGYKYTAPVGTYPPNKLGLYDMAGNVWEWCEDWYDKDYYKKTNNAKNPINKKRTSSFRIARGGSWLSGIGVCRSVDRFGKSPDGGYYYLGFRIVRVPGNNK